MTWVSLETFALLASVVGLLYLYLTWHHSHWKKKRIAYEKPNLLFGSLKDSFLMKKPMGSVFTDLYMKYPKEKVVGWFKFRSPALLIRDPDIIHKVLVTDFNSFRNNEAELEEDADPIIGRHLFVKKDDLWKNNRALITPAFTAGKIKLLFPEMVAVAQEFVIYLRKHPGELHMKHTLSRYTTEVVAKCALGIEGNCFKEEKPTILEMGKLIFKQDAIQGLKLISFHLMPTITKLLKIRIVPYEVVQFFDSVLRDVIVYRQDNNIQRNDLTQFLIDQKKKTTMEVENGDDRGKNITRRCSDEDVLSGCVLFFMENYEISTLLLTNILYLLAMHPDKQAILRQEVDAAFKNGEPTFEALNEMNYLNCVILETNRIMPVLFALNKRCTEFYKMDIGGSEKLVIEKGTSIVIPLFAIHNDPKYWEDADDFRPERFANKEDVTAKAKGLFLPFGDGPRMCIGVRISSTLMKVAIAHILLHFEVAKTSRTPNKIEPDPTNFLMVHKGVMFLRFIPRADQ